MGLRNRRKNETFWQLRSPDIDLLDFPRFRSCLEASGPSEEASRTCVQHFDYDDDSHIDLIDVSYFTRAFTGIR